MFLDALLLLSDAQAVTADAVSTNTIDLSNVTPKRRVGTGESITVFFSVDVAADFTTTDETYAFQVIASASADLSSPTVLQQRTLTAAQLVAGAKFVVDVPIDQPQLRYLGVNYDVGGTTPTITVTACVVPSDFVDAWMAYAKGYSF